MLNTDPEIATFNQLSAEDRKKLLEDFRSVASCLPDRIKAEERVNREHSLQQWRPKASLDAAVIKRLWILRHKSLKQQDRGEDDSKGYATY